MRKEETEHAAMMARSFGKYGALCWGGEERSSLHVFLCNEERSGSTQTALERGRIPSDAQDFRDEVATDDFPRNSAENMHISVHFTL